MTRNNISWLGFHAIVFCLFIFPGINSTATFASDPAVTGAKREPLLTDEGFLYESINVLLPRLADKGLRGETIRQNPKLKRFRFPREAPRATFHVPTNAANIEVKGFKPISFELLEEAGIERNAVVRFGVPFPEKTLYSVESLEVRNPEGKSVPAQMSATELWPDGSIRWLLVQLTTKLAAGEKSVYSLRFVSKPSPVASPLKIEETEDRMIVDTGAMRAVIDKNRFNILQSVSVGGQTVGGFDDLGLTGRSDTGRVFSSSKIKPRRIALEEKGPETIVVRIDGSYAYDDGRPAFLNYTARLRFFKNSARIQMDVTTIKSGLENEFDDFENLRLTFNTKDGIEKFSGSVYDVKTTLYQNKAGVEARKFSRNVPVTWTQYTDRDCGFDGTKTHPGRIASGVQLRTEKNSVALAIRDLWKRWPKGFSAEKNRFTFEILPALPSKKFGLDLPHYLAFPFREGCYRLKWGMSFTETLLLDFDADSDGAALQAEADFPVVAVVDRDWYAQSDVVAGVTKTSDRTFDGWDAKRTRRFYEHLKLKEEQREYGFLNFGDWYGERGTNWGNNEYDLPKSLFSAFARTGNRDLFRLAVATAMHQADVDMIHAHPDPYYLGGQTVHAIAHTGYYGQKPSAKEPKGRRGTWSYPPGWYIPASNGHTWVGGLLDCWRFAGTARTRDAALQLGEHITWCMVRVFNRLGTHERSAGWSLTAICMLAESTNDPEYLKAAKRIVAIPLKEQNFEKGGAWPHVLPADHAGKNKNTFGNAVFLIGTVVEGLRRYHRLTDDPAAQKSLEAACGWLQKTRQPDKGQWPYTASWDGNAYISSNQWGVYLSPALLYTARICDRKDYFETACEGLRSAYRAEKTSGFGKTYAQSGLFLYEMMQELKNWEKEHGSKPELFE